MESLFPNQRVVRDVLKSMYHNRRGLNLLHPALRYPQAFQAMAYVQDIEAPGCNKLRLLQQFPALLRNLPVLFGMHDHDAHLRVAC